MSLHADGPSEDLRRDSRARRTARKRAAGLEDASIMVAFLGLNASARSPLAILPTLRLLAANGTGF